MEITQRVISGEASGEKGGKGTGNNKHKWQEQNRQGSVKNSIGKGEAKELTHMTHGHEIKGGFLEGKGIYIPFAPLEEGGKGNINWVNFNSIINKYIF